MPQHPNIAVEGFSLFSLANPDNLSNNSYKSFFQLLFLKLNLNNYLKCILMILY